MQTILRASENYNVLDKYVKENDLHKVFLVCDHSLQYLRINEYFENMEERTGIKLVKFSDIQPNPLYESVIDGVSLFRREACDSIVAVGGGSVVDVAKCIKCYSSCKGDGTNGGFLTQSINQNKVKLIAIPTTAGTGSEATRYAVVYFNNEKQSIMDDSLIPEMVLFDTSVLRSLSDYQKKSTMLDALCHAIESYWSVNSTNKSKEYARQAIKLILDNIDGYQANKEETFGPMLSAANIAGKAINITQTTAGHAMCYKLTSIYGIAHGHAAALCVKEIWRWMLKNTASCVDQRGRGYLEAIFTEIGKAMGCEDGLSAAERFEGIVRSLNMSVPKASDADYDTLKYSVNLIRLKNNPVALDTETINILYHRILDNT